MRKFILGAAGAALIAGGTIAHAAPAVRAAAPVAEAEELASGEMLLGLLGAAVLGVILWQVIDDDDADLPTSP